MSTDPNNAENEENENSLDYEELTKLAESGELTQEMLQDKLAAYSRAVEEEFTTAQHAADSPEAEYATLKEFWRQHAPQAAARIVHLSLRADTHSVQFSASKYILTAAYRDVEASETSDDPLRELFKDLGADLDAPKTHGQDPVRIGKHDKHGTERNNGEDPLKKNNHGVR